MANYNPEDYELITTMWYTLTDDNGDRNRNYVYLQGRDPEDAISSQSVRSLSTGPNNPLGAWAPLGDEFSIYYNANYIEVNGLNSSITKPYRKWSNLISVPNGQVSAEGFIYDKPYDSEKYGSCKSFTLNVSSASGIFENAKIMHITIDNDGSVFGRKYGRRVEVFKLKPRQTEETPPDFSGIWEWKAYLYGNLNGKQIPLDNPLEIISLYEIKQNGKFIESTPFTNFPDPVPERSPQPGVLEPTYNENLQFMGWKLIVADSTFDNGSWNAFATIMENNVVMECRGTYKESGFQEGNPLQSPLVGYATAKRIFPDLNFITDL